MELRPPDDDRTDAKTTEPTLTDRVAARIGKHEFIGTLIGRGYDRDEPVVYVRDRRGRERAVRVRRPRHELLLGARQ